MEKVFQKFKELEGRFLTEEDVKELAKVIEDSAGEYYFTKKVKKMNEVLDEIRKVYNIPEDSIFKFKFAFRGKRDKGTKGEWEVGAEYGGNIYKTRASGRHHLDVIVWEGSNKMIGMKLERKGGEVMKEGLKKIAERLIKVSEDLLKLNRRKKTGAIPPEELGEWERFGFTKEEAERWSEVGFTPEKALDWKNEGFDPDEAKEWSEAGFDLEEAAKWLNLVSPDEAKEWKKFDFSPDDVEGWLSVGIRDPRKADRWKEIMEEFDLPLYEILDYIKMGYTPGKLERELRVVEEEEE